MRIPGARQVELHSRIASTNLRARELVAQGAPPFTVVVADEQSGGRGRSGKGWHSPPGGLWISVLLPPPADGPHGRVSILLGVATAEALEEVAGVEIGLKWPNDLLLTASEGGEVLGKVGGILCEVASGTGHRALLVAGFGVNLLRFPVGIRPAGAVALEEGTSREVERGGVATALVEALRRWVDPPPPGGLPLAALQAWARRDLLLGHGVVTSDGRRGVADGIDPTGTLRLRQENGEVAAIVSGSVRRQGEGTPALFAGRDLESG